MGSPATAIDIRDRVESSRPAYLPLLVFSCGHFFVDMYSIAQGVLQLLRAVQFGSCLTQAGMHGGMALKLPK